MQSTLCIDGKFTFPRPPSSSAQNAPGALHVYLLEPCQACSEGAQPPQDSFQATSHQPLLLNPLCYSDTMFLIFSRTGPFCVLFPLLANAAGLFLRSLFRHTNFCVPLTHCNFLCITLYCTLPFTAHLCVCLLYHVD